MHEIQCHPWVTYTEFPKYIDHKFTKDRTINFKRKRHQILEKRFAKIKSKSDQFKNMDQFIEAIKTNEKNHSFITEVKLQQSESFERMRELKASTKKKQLTNIELPFPVKHNYSFNLLSQLFADQCSVTKFQNTFNNYTIHHNNSLNITNWRIGFNFSTNLKKIIKNLIFQCNKLKIKIVPYQNEDFSFRCSIFGPTGETDKTFRIQIFENIGEYVIDFKNETCSKIQFLLICFKMFKLEKV